MSIRNIDDLRSQYPELADRSDDEVIGQYSKEVGMQPTTVRALLGGQPSQREPDYGNVSRAFRSYGHQLKGLGAGAAALAADYVGADGLRDNLYETYQRSTDRMGELQKDSYQLSHLMDGGTLRDWGDAAAFYLPTGLLNLAGGGLAGAVGKGLTRTAVNQGVRRGLGRKIREMPEEQARRQVEKVANRGFYAGLGGFFTAQTTGDAYGKAGQVQFEKGNTLDDIDKNRALAGGVAAGTIQFAGNVAMLGAGRFLPRSAATRVTEAHKRFGDWATAGNLPTRVAKGAAIGAPIEAVTEPTQELLTDIGAGVDITFDEEYRAGMMQAAFAGAMSSGGSQALVGGLRGDSRRLKPQEGQGNFNNRQTDADLAPQGVINDENRQSILQDIVGLDADQITLAELENRASLQESDLTRRDTRERPTTYAGAINRTVGLDSKRPSAKSRQRDFEAALKEADMTEIGRRPGINQREAIVTLGDVVDQRQQERESGVRRVTTEEFKGRVEEATGVKEDNPAVREQRRKQAEGAIKEAFDEPSGIFVVSPDGRTEYELSMGEFLEWNAVRNYNMNLPEGGKPIRSNSKVLQNAQATKIVVVDDQGQLQEVPLNPNTAEYQRAMELAKERVRRNAKAKYTQRQKTVEGDSRAAEAESVANPEAKMAEFAQLDANTLRTRREDPETSAAEKRLINRELSQREETARLARVEIMKDPIFTTEAGRKALQGRTRQDDGTPRKDLIDALENFRSRDADSLTKTISNPRTAAWKRELARAVRNEKDQQAESQQVGDSAQTRQPQNEGDAPATTDGDAPVTTETRVVQADDVPGLAEAQNQDQIRQAWANTIWSEGGGVLQVSDGTVFGARTRTEDTKTGKRELIDLTRVDESGEQTTFTYGRPKRRQPEAWTVAHGTDLPANNAQFRVGEKIQTPVVTDQVGQGQSTDSVPATLAVQDLVAGMERVQLSPQQQKVWDKLLEAIVNYDFDSVVSLRGGERTSALSAKNIGQLAGMSTSSVNSALRGMRDKFRQVYGDDVEGVLASLQAKRRKMQQDDTPDSPQIGEGVDQGEISRGNLTVRRTDKGESQLGTLDAPAIDAALANEAVAETMRSVYEEQTGKSWDNLSKKQKRGWFTKINEDAQRQQDEQAAQARIAEEAEQQRAAHQEWINAFQGDSDGSRIIGLYNQLAKNSPEPAARVPFMELDAGYQQTVIDAVMPWLAQDSFNRAAIETRNALKEITQAIQDEQAANTRLLGQDRTTEGASVGTRPALEQSGRVVSEEAAGTPGQTEATAAQTRARNAEVIVKKKRRTVKVQTDDGDVSLHMLDADAVTEGPPITQQEAQSVVDAITNTRGWKSLEDLSVQVINSIADLRNLSDRARGLYSQLTIMVGEDGARTIAGVKTRNPDGSFTVYVIAEGSKTKQMVEETILHEVAGHVGLHKYMGKGKDEQLASMFLGLGNDTVMQIADRLGVGDDLRRYRKHQGYKTYENYASMMMDEMLAFASGRKKNKGFRAAFKRALGEIRQWLRSMGFLETSKLSDGEILVLMKRANQAVAQESGLRPFHTPRVGAERLARLREMEQRGYDTTVLFQGDVADNVMADIQAGGREFEAVFNQAVEVDAARAQPRTADGRTRRSFNQRLSRERSKLRAEAEDFQSVLDAMDMTIDEYMISYPGEVSQRLAREVGRLQEEAASDLRLMTTDDRPRASDGIPLRSVNAETDSPPLLGGGFQWAKDNLLDNALGDKAGELYTRAKLGLMTLDQMAERSPYAAVRNFRDAVNKVQRSAKTILNSAHALNNHWATLQNQKHEQVTTMHRLMRETTMEQYDPTYQKPTNAKQRQMKKAFDALDFDVKVLYADVRDTYAGYYNDQLKIMEDAILHAEAMDNGRRATELRRDLSEMRRMKGPYFPLKRLGDYFVVGMSDDMAKLYSKNQEAPLQGREKALYQRMRKDEKHYRVESFNSTFRARQRRDELRKTMGEQTFYNRAVDFYRAESIDVPNIQQIEQYFVNSDMPAETVSQVRAILARMYADMLPMNSEAKSRMEREGVAGADENMRAVFSQSAIQNAHKISRLRHGSEINQAMQEVGQLGRNGDRLGMETRGEIAKRIELMYSQQHSPAVNALMNTSYFAHLGLSPAYFATNASQVGVVAMPYLAGTHGVGSVIAQVGKAYKDAGKLMKVNYGRDGWRAEIRWDGLVSEGDGRALQALLDNNLLDITIEHDLHNSAAGGEGIGQFSSRGEFLQFMNTPARFVELVNRATTGLAAYRLEQAKLTRERTQGKNQFSDAQIEQQAIDYTVKATGESQLNYSGLNRPRYFQQVLGSKPLARMMGQFRMFQQGMVYLMLSNMSDAMSARTKQERVIARRRLLGLFTTTGMLGGIQATPLVGTLAFALNAMKGLWSDDDEPADIFVEIRNGLTEMFATGGGLDEQSAQRMSNMLMKGLPTLADVDISQRISLGQMLFPTPFARWSDRHDENLNTLLLSAIGGAPVGYAGRAIQGASDLMSADTENERLRAAEQVVPIKFAQNIIRSFRFHEHGMTDRSGEPIFDQGEFTGTELFWRAFGYSTRREANFYDATSRMYDVKNALTNRRNDLIRRHAQASLAGDRDRVTQVTEEIRAFNERNAQEYPSARITHQSLRRAARNRRDIRQSRNETGMRTDRGFGEYVERFAQ